MPISTARRMLTCRWTARQLHRYLDADPSVPLEPTEIRRLEEHLSQCENCSGLTTEYRVLGRLLHRLSAACEPDPRSIARLRDQLSTITHGERE